jgi:hypothetical protein
MKIVVVKEDERGMNLLILVDVVLPSKAHETVCADGPCF